MENGPLAKQITDLFESLPKKLKIAARYVIDHPRDVALLSMREQARRAGLQPPTMTRLAQHLGLSGYDALREAYAAAVRGGDLGFTPKAGATSAYLKRDDVALATKMLSSLSTQIASLGNQQTVESLVSMAKRLASARCVYCLSLRSIHPVAWHFHYIMSLIGERSVLLDGVGATGLDAFANATSEDVLLCATVQPYTRGTVELAQLAARRGVAVLAITDSTVSPIAQIAQHTVLVPTSSPGLFHAMSPAFIVAEVLAALIAAKDHKKTLTALRTIDDHLGDLDTHVSPAFRQTSDGFARAKKRPTRRKPRK